MILKSLQKTPLCEMIPRIMVSWGTFESINDSYLQKFVRNPYDSPAVIRLKFCDGYDCQIHPYTL